MVADEPGAQCAGTNADGSPCRVPSEMVLDSGYCYAHDPDLEEQRKAVRQRGGMTQALKSRRGLDPSELPELRTPEDAQLFASVLAQAVATGRLSSAQATAATRALAQWLSSRDLHVRESRLTKIEEVLRAEGRL